MSNPSIKKYRERFETHFQEALNQTDIPALKIKEAIQYTLFPGGKRLRPLLIYLSGELLEVNIEILDILAISIELIHCYSLVHDDLPAMDNDDYRRGKPSCHRAFDEATAILTGDGLQALAIELLLANLPHHLDYKRVNLIAHDLLKACGPSGMISGQSLDLSELAKGELTEAQLCQIHQLKTGKLISACINTVLLAKEPSLKATESLQTFARHLGLFFQMQDDYLDKYDTKNLGKFRQSDAINQKITFASLYKKQDLLNLVNQHLQKARAELVHFDSASKTLNALLQSLQLRHNEC